MNMFEYFTVMVDCMKLSMTLISLKEISCEKCTGLIEIKFERNYQVHLFNRYYYFYYVIIFSGRTYSKKSLYNNNKVE